MDRYQKRKQGADRVNGCGCGERENEINILQKRKYI